LEHEKIWNNTDTPKTRRLQLNETPEKKRRKEKETAMWKKSLVIEISNEYNNMP